MNPNRRSFLKALVLGTAMAFPVAKLRLLDGAGWESDNPAYWRLQWIQRTGCSVDEPSYGETFAYCGEEIPDGWEINVPLTKYYSGNFVHPPTDYT